MVCSSLIWLSNWVSSSSVMEYVEAQETCGKDNNKHSNKHQVLFFNDPHPLSSDHQGKKEHPGQNAQQIA